MKKCIVKECENKYRCKGYCEMHYRRFLTHGKTEKTTTEFCTIKECNNKHNALGYCLKHYTRFKKHGDPHKFIIGRAPNNNFCKFTGCDKKQRSRGYCATHYNRLYKHGSPSIILKMGAKPEYTNIDEKFLNSFEIITESGCWIWNGAFTGQNYGMLKLANFKKLAHRYSYERFKGPIPENMFICHRCDIPCCVNPNHLFLGTQSDNMHDRNTKNRQAKGERIGHAKLTESQVKKIRISCKPYAELSASYNVSYSVIAKIKRRESWKHIT